MAKSLTQIEAEIEQLKKEAEALRKEEVDGVIARIREAIEVYELTPGDLFVEKRRPQRTNTPTTKGIRAGTRSASTGNREVKFRDSAGNTWGGRGPRPRWLREAIANGASLEQFAV